MSLGNIGKVLAGQAFEATKKNMIDAVVGPEPAKPSDKPAAPPVPESIGGLILGQIQAMQRPLKDDQELHVLYHTGGETLRVTEIFVPNIQLFVLAGQDGNGNIMRAIVPAEHARLVCKIMKVATDAHPIRLSILSPRPKPENA